VRGVVIGAGDRGQNAYAPYLLRRPGEGRIVAVAEPDPARRAAFVRRFGLSSGAGYADYRDLLDRPRLAEFAVVATPDPLHVEPAVLAMERGYHVLLEKPMAVTEADCRRLVEVSERTGRLLQVCHVLRYAPLFRALREVVASGEIGDAVTIQHSENVSYWHYAHSYCRGQWRNTAASSPMILAKSCHDLDVLYWLAGSTPRRLTSLARPTQLRVENAPPGAPEFCVEGCPHAATCPYDAVALYRDLLPLLLDLEKTVRPRGAGGLARLVRHYRALVERVGPEILRERAVWRRWPVAAITGDFSREGLDRALRTTRYGRCVYRIGDNDQVSSQTVNVAFGNGVNAVFTMHSTSHREGRETRIDGTRGSVVSRFHTLEQGLVVHDHKSGKRRRLRMPATLGVHGGGDTRLFAAFLAALRGEAEPETTARESLWSHVMAFAADRAAREGVVVEFPPNTSD
jgi:predicted dehydrogenase